MKYSFRLFRAIRIAARRFGAGPRHFVSDAFGREDAQAVAIRHGITRALILERAPELGLTVKEGPIPAHQFDQIEELFLSGTTTEVMPISKVDNKLVRDGKPGPVTRKLQEAFKRWRSE